MRISKETKEKINFLFKNNPDMIEKLNNCDVEAIREIERQSQRGINPEDVIVACKSGDPITMDYLCRQAQRLVGLQELYKELCFEYYKNTKDTPEYVEYASSHKRNI